MATYYVRLRATLERAANATFANADVHATEQSSSGTEGATFVVDATTGPATTVTLSIFPNGKCLMVENLGTTAGTTVTAAYQNKAAAAQSCVLPIAAEGVALFITPDVLASANMTLTSSAGSIPVKITVIG